MDCTAVICHYTHAIQYHLPAYQWVPFRHDLGAGFQLPGGQKINRVYRRGAICVFYFFIRCGKKRGQMVAAPLACKRILDAVYYRRNIRIAYDFVYLAT